MCRRRSLLPESRLVADRMRTSTSMVSLEPTRVISWLSSTRSSLICVGSGMSPTSSRNSVPPFAYSNLPTRSALASVKAPLMWPKSSLSRMFSLNAAQFKSDEGALSCEGCFDESLGRQVPCQCPCRLGSGSSRRWARFDAAVQSLSCICGLLPITPSKPNFLVEPATQFGIRTPQVLIAGSIVDDRSQAA